MVAESESESELKDQHKRTKLASDGSYVLRPIVNNVPLASESSTKKPHITCVELWGQSFNSCVWYFFTSVEKQCH